jgi:hypothetical protein
VIVEYNGVQKLSFGSLFLCYDHFLKKKVGDPDQVASSHFWKDGICFILAEQCHQRTS